MAVADYDDMKFTPELRLRRLEQLLEGLVEHTATPKIGTITSPIPAGQTIPVGNWTPFFTRGIHEIDTKPEINIEIIPAEIVLIHKEIDIIRNQQISLFSHINQIENTKLLSKERINRTLKCSIYLGDGNLDVAKNVESAVDYLLEVIGFGLMIRGSPRYGSWYRDLFFRSKEILSNQDVQKRLKKAERAAELQFYGRTQSDIDLKTAEAVTKLKASIKDEDSAVILIGNLFIAKYKQGNGHSSITLTLSHSQLEAFENHPDPFTDPARLVDYLQNLNKPHPQTVDSELSKGVYVQHIQKPRNNTKRRNKTDPIKAELEGKILSEESVRQIPPPSSK